MSGESQDVLYYLNEGDEVVTVNSAWNRFARENGAHEALGPRVQWRPVWAFISDGTTSLLCRRLIRRAREGRTVDFSFRCDSPATIRLARMRMQVLRTGLLEICVRTVRAVDRRAVPIRLDARSTSGNPQWCSWCQRVELLPGAWMDAGEAARERGALDWGNPLEVRPGSCPECVARMIGVADSVRDMPPLVPSELWPPSVGRPAEEPVAGEWHGLAPQPRFAGWA